MQVLMALPENVAPSCSDAEPPTKQPRLAPETPESFRVQRISSNATLPTRGSAKAAGYDISRCDLIWRQPLFKRRGDQSHHAPFDPPPPHSRRTRVANAHTLLPLPVTPSARSAEDCIIPARGKHCVSTGLRIAVPAGTYGRVAPRSGLAAKHFIDTGAGVVDEDYRGELKVLLFNHSDADFAGERHAVRPSRAEARTPLARTPGRPVGGLRAAAVALCAGCWLCRQSLRRLVGDPAGWPAIPQPKPCRRSASPALIPHPLAVKAHPHPHPHRPSPSANLPPK
jgi:dUTPase